MIWMRMLAYITGTVDQELLLRNEYLAAENRILRAQIKGRLLLSDAEKATLAEIAHLWSARIPSSSHLTEMLTLICPASLFCGEINVSNLRRHTGKH